jgi:nickel-type superoxide dismutase maturation protease
VLLAVVVAFGADLATPYGRVRRILATLARSWQARVAVEGPSMEPTIRAGDWLLVDPQAYRERPPRPGDLVLAPDPRADDRLLIKRVDSVDPDGWLRLAGDDPDQSTDSRAFGAVDPATVAGAPWFRYWPPGRIARLR